MNEMNPLENLYSLMNDMREKGWTITRFFVLLQRYRVYGSC